jgi:tetratricopeptide (TPR) repeat protein
MGANVWVVRDSVLKMRKLMANDGASDTIGRSISPLPPTTAGQLAPWCQNDFRQLLATPLHSVHTSTISRFRSSLFLVKRCSRGLASGLRQIGIFAIWGLFVTFAQADDYDDVATLIRGGQNTEALPRIERFLQTRPRDAQMRFFKGLIQRETGKPVEALATFNELVQDYPELPEPYNNLAVIYASQNELEKARAALEMALRNNPAYTIAYENMGDVLTRMALQAYQRAQQLGAGSGRLAPKIEALTTLVVSTTLKK